jgi:hyperosmotically inducible periplasmic protein
MKTTLLFTAAVMASALLAGCNRSSNDSGTGAANDNQSTTSGSGAGSAAPGDNNANSASSTRAPNNTGLNTRDRSDSTLTPGDQGGTDADRETTQRIRRALTSNDQLSADAKNIKIITLNGKVTLRGPVKDVQEEQAVESIVKQMGITSLDNQLEPKATNQ